MALKRGGNPLQLEIPFSTPSLEAPILPRGFRSFEAFSVFLKDKAARSIFGEHCFWLKQWEIVVTYIDVLPSLILQRYDKVGWERVTLEAYGRVLFGGHSFREISIKTCGGTKKTKNIAELTANMQPLENFEEIWRREW